MRKSKLYIFISILTIIFLFGTAALFDQCSILTGLKVDEEEEKEAEEEAIEKKEEPEEETIEEASEEEIAEQTKEETEEKEEPEEETPGEALQALTIDLLIYEGPTYSVDDNVCYFRIEAIVTGNPAPIVSFSRDDSNGAWGPLKAQINLNAPAETYTLSATATNSEGAVTDSIELSWGCSPVTRDVNNDPIVYDINIVGGTPLYWPESKYGVYATASDPDGDNLTYYWSVSGGSIDDVYTNPTAWNTPNTGGTHSITVSVNDGNGGIDSITKSVNVSQALLLMPPVTMEFPIVTSEGGIFGYNSSDTLETIIPLPPPYEVGDTEYNWTRFACISFDISGLSGDILSAHLTFNLSSQVGDPSSFLPLRVTAAYWGATTISIDEWYASGRVFGRICEVNNPNFSADNGHLKTELLRAIENGRDRFQILVSTGRNPPCDNDNYADLWIYNVDDISLIVTYRP